MINFDKITGKHRTEHNPKKPFVPGMNQEKPTH